MTIEYKDMRNRMKKNCIVFAESGFDRDCARDALEQ